MSSFTLDTTIIKNSAANIKDLAKKYNTNMDSMFESLNSMPTNNIWVGTEGNSSVYTFLERVMKEKDQYVDVANYITNYGTLIESLANSMENVINSKIGEG